MRSRAESAAKPAEAQMRNHTTAHMDCGGKRQRDTALAGLRVGSGAFSHGAIRFNSLNSLAKPIRADSSHS
jgi:hypothetical protein